MMSHTKSLWSSVIAVVVYLTSLGPARPAIAVNWQSSDEAALRIVVEQFFAAYGKKDLTALIRLWSEKSPDLATNKQTLQQQFTNEDHSFVSPAISRIKPDGDKVSLRVAVDLSTTNLQTKQTRQERIVRSFTFVKEGGEWKVWRYVPAANDLAESLVKAKTEAERAALMAEEKELVTVELVRALNTQAVRFFNQRDYAQALAVFHLAHSVAEQTGDRAAIARVMNSIGTIHNQQGNYVRALEYYQKSVAISEVLGDKVLLVRALNNIGVIHARQGNYAQALEYFQKSFTASETLSDKEVVRSTLQNIGNIHSAQGNYAQALEYYHKSLVMSEAVGDKAGIASTLNNIAMVHQLQGNDLQAMEHYQKSLTMKEVLGDKVGIAVTLGNIGFVHNSQGNYAQAMEHYQKSLTMREALGDKDGVGSTLNNIGDLHERNDNHVQALEYYQKSLAIREAIGDKAGIALSLGNIGKLYNKQGLHTQALDFAERAAALARQIGSLDTLWQTQLTTGIAYRALNQLAQARQAFADSISTIETMRTQVAGTEQDAQLFFEGKLSPYLAMVDLLISQNQTTEAFAYVERAKARVLLDVLRSGRVNVSKAMTAQEQEQERSLKNRLVSINAQIYRENLGHKPDQARLSELHARLEKARLDYEIFQTNLYAAHPELKAQRGEAQPLTLDQTNALLPDLRTALLEYVVTDEKTYLFVLTRNGVGNRATVDLKVYPIEIKSKDLAERAERFRQMLATTDTRFRKPARELFDLLIKPAAVQLQGKTQLVVVPDGPLWDMPFQALQTTQNRYLLEEHAISYVPSLTVLREMVKARSRETSTTGPTLLALGNPALGKETVARVKSVLMDEKLDPLPEAEKQVQALGQIYGPHQSKVYIGAEAREDRFKAEAGNHTILHLAAHGILNNRSPMYSHIVLSQAGEGANEDGLLEAWELMKLDLKARLVVLSACETARGRLGRGEGIIGLTWAIFVAGSPTTVVSQWKVESASTTKLMLEFHRQLRSKVGGPQSRINKAEALRKAALRLLQSDQYSHPFYWAGFVVVGDGF